MIDFGIGDDGNDGCLVLNEGDGAVFQFTSCKPFGLDIGDLFEFQSGFQSHIIIDATTDEKTISACQQCSCMISDGF